MKRGMLLEELQIFFSRPLQPVMLVAVPWAVFMLVAAIYLKGSARELPVAAFDQDRSAMSRMMIRSFDATGSMRVVEEIQNEDDIAKLFAAHKVYGVIRIPSGFERDIKRNKPSYVTYYKNSAGIVISNTLLSDANNVVRTISAGVLLQKLRGKGFGYEQTLGIASPTRLQTQILYNPYYNYQYFLPPMVFLAMLQIIMIVMGVLRGAALRTEFAQLSLSETMRKFASAAAVYLLTLAFTLTVIFASAKCFYKLEFPGLGGGLALAFVFMSALFFIGLALALIMKSKFMAAEAAVFVLTPAFVLSGYTFPVEAMPSGLRIVALISPFTHFLRGFLKIGYMCAPLSAAKTEIAVISLIAAVAVTAALGAAVYSCRPAGGQPVKARVS